MKKLKITASLWVVTLCLLSCEQEEFIYQEEHTIATTRAITIHKNLGFDWENIAKVNIGGVDVILPWYSGSPASLPSYILDDYKKENGCVLDKISNYEVKTEAFYKEGTELNDATIIDQCIYGHRGPLSFEINTYIDGARTWDYYWDNPNFIRTKTPSKYFEESKFRCISEVTVLLYPKAPYSTDVISMTRTFAAPVKKVSIPSKGIVYPGI